MLNYLPSNQLNDTWKENVSWSPGVHNTAGWGDQDGYGMEQSLEWA